MKNTYLLFVLLLTLIAKIVLAINVPIFADEAYYYIWTLRPQLSYFDHPAMVSWLISLSEPFSHLSTQLGVRFLFVICSTLTLYFWVLILKKNQYSEKQSLFFLLLLVLNPLFGVGSILATPDVPLVLFWTMSYWAYLHLFEQNSPAKRILWYSLLGIFLGLGFCSKYHIVLFLFAGFVDILVHKRYRQITWAYVPATIISGLIFCLPVLLWNAQNEWASFTYQLKHGFGKTYYDPSWTVSFILGQAFILNPFVTWSFIRSKPKTSDWWFAISGFGFFLLSSFKAVVEANWPITAQAHATASATQKMSGSLFKKNLFFWAIFYLLITGLLLSPYKDKILKNQYNSTQTNAIAHLVDKYKPLYGSSYQIASLLSWQTKSFIPKLNGLSRFDFFDTLAESKPTEKTIYVLKHFDSIWPEKYNQYQKTFLERFDDLGIELYQLSYE